MHYQQKILEKRLDYMIHCYRKAHLSFCRRMMPKVIKKQQEKKMEKEEVKNGQKETSFKKYLIYAAVFLALGIIFGVFYREFSKAYGVVNVYTPLGLVHTHFLVLGVLFILIIGLVTDKLNKGSKKLFKYAFLLYVVGVSGAGVMMAVRGMLDVLVKSDKIIYTVSDGANGAISGLSGIFHALLGVGIVLIFVSWFLKDKKVSEN